MRDTSVYATKTERGERFDWQGWYRPAEQENEFQLFLTSRKFDSALPDAENKVQVWGEKWRSKFDALAWVNDDAPDGKPIVGVIRPPLTRKGTTLAYGLSVELVEPSGQTRFTFTKTQVDTLAERLLALRDRESRDRGTALALIPRNLNKAKDFYIRKLTGNKRWDAAPGVCDSASHLPPV